jgi:hypothetical protein
MIEKSSDTHYLVIFSVEVVLRLAVDLTSTKYGLLYDNARRPAPRRTSVVAGIIKWYISAGVAALSSFTSQPMCISVARPDGRLFLPASKSS